MKKTLHNRLKNYSALTAVAIIGVNEAQADIIHTDVNYTGGYESYSVDIDGDLVDDFLVIAGAGGSGGFYYAAVNIEGAISSNAIQGAITAYYNYASALSVGKLIYSTQGTFVSSPVLAGSFSITYPFAYAGDIGQFGDGNEHFVGAKFEISGDIHYGWLRFKDVAQNGSSWTLVDMAYNDVAGKEIKTGQLVGVEETTESKFDLYSNGNQLNVSVENEFSNASLEIIDLTGKVVLSDKLNSTKSNISYDLPKSIYIVRLFTNEKSITRKINL